MAPITKERAREEPPKKVSKRQKFEQKLDVPVSDHAIDPDKLQWDIVKFPDNFEDAEGFFGLEEVSNIDIVKNLRAGKVEYKASRSANHMLIE